MSNCSLYVNTRSRR